MMRDLNRFQLDSGKEYEISLEVMERIKDVATLVDQDVQVLEHGERSRIDRIYTWGPECGWVIFVYTRGGRLFARRPWEYSVS